MPELPEVETVVQDLKASITNKNLINVEFYYPTTHVNLLDDEMVFDLVKDVSRRGKYILINLINGYSIIVHLRMTGKLIYQKENITQLSHERARFFFESKDILIFDDIRTFGKITYIKSKDLDQYFIKLGPEPLSDKFNYDYIKNSVSKINIPIKSYLLDQRRIAGIGNIYACEILYRCGINPLIPASKVKPSLLKKIVNETKQVLTEAIECNGTTISDFRRVDNKTGSFQNFLQVYGKEKCPLKHPVERIKIAGRSTYYCKTCQK